MFPKGDSLGAMSSDWHRRQFGPPLSDWVEHFRVVVHTTKLFAAEQEDLSVQNGRLRSTSGNWHQW